jgi:hypothetical protein
VQYVVRGIRTGSQEVGVAAGDDLGGDDPLVAPLVGEQEATDDVADGVDTRLGGAQVRARLDEAAFDLDRSGVQADVLGVAGAADGDEEDLGLQPLLLPLAGDDDGHPALLALDRADVESRTGQAADPPRLEVLLELRPDRPVLQGHQPVEHLHHGYLRAAAPPERRSKVSLSSCTAKHVHRPPGPNGNGSPPSVRRRSVP